MSRDQEEQQFTLPVTKIISIHRDAWLANTFQRSLASANERGRHFLKVTLPAIPICVFTLTFLLVYFIDAIDATRNHRPIDPMPALIGALCMAVIVGAICTAIYSGFLQVTGVIEDEMRDKVSL